MRPRRRRRSDADEPRPFWRTIPHYYAYPALGALMGLGSPIGAFALRYSPTDSNNFPHPPIYCSYKLFTKSNLNYTNTTHRIMYPLLLTV